MRKIIYILRLLSGVIIFSVGLLVEAVGKCILLWANRLVDHRREIRDE